MATVLRAVTLAAPCVLVAPAALAQADPYKQHMDNGVKLYADRNYPAAVAEFEAAYAASAKASPLINLALCYKAQFRYPKAIETLEKALTKHLDTMDEADRKAALEAINEMKALLAHVKVTVAPPGAALTVDGEPHSADAVKKPIPVGPGVHTFAATLDGHTPASKELRVVSGESKELKLELMPVATKPGDPAKPPASKSGNYSTPMMVAGIVSGSLGLLSAVTGISIYAIKETTCPPDEQEKPPEEQGDGCDDDKRHALGATLMVVGGVLIAAGIPMFIVGAGPAEKQAPPKTARPQVLVGPGSAALRWSF